MNPTDKLKQAFHESIGVALDTDFATVKYGETPNWDSVAHMGLVAEVERQFDVMMSTEDVIDMSSFSKAQEILSQRHGVSF
ncbi:MAG: acyl carrier protein [Bryobacteraceae bacterium]